MISIDNIKPEAMAIVCNKLIASYGFSDHEMKDIFAFSKIPILYNLLFEKKDQKFYIYFDVQHTNNLLLAINTLECIYSTLLFMEGVAYDSIKNTHIRYKGYSTVKFECDYYG